MKECFDDLDKSDTFIEFFEREFQHLCQTIDDKITIPTWAIITYVATVVLLSIIIAIKTRYTCSYTSE